MSHRVTLTLDDEAYAIYQARPHHQRGRWASAVIKASVHYPPFPPAGWLDMTAWLVAAWQRWQAQQTGQ